MGLGLAIRVFFRVLADNSFAQSARNLLDGGPPKPAAPQPPSRPQPTRSDSLTLLSVLQRDARLVDFLKEDLRSYSDAQIGSAVRDVHRNSAAVLERLYAIRPIRAEPESAIIDIPSGYDASRLRLVGNVTASPPPRAALRHAGWQATKTDLPEWTGAESAALIISPAEAEVA